MILYGTAHRVGDTITTAQIIAPELRDAGDPALLAGYCLAAVDASLAERLHEGDMLLAGTGFGAGDDPETAVLALQALGVAAIICAGAAPGFVEAAEAFGLPVVVCPAAGAVADGSQVRLDLARGQLINRSTGVGYAVASASAALLAVLERTQVLRRMRRVVEDEGFDG